MVVQYQLNGNACLVPRVLSASFRRFFWLISWFSAILRPCSSSILLSFSKSKSVKFVFFLLKTKTNMLKMHLQLYLLLDQIKNSMQWISLHITIQQKLSLSAKIIGVIWKTTSWKSEWNIQKQSEHFASMNSFHHQQSKI